ncbi:MAG: gliding motility-associated C-terminal domain-containing protein [Flavobacteriales bacterium]|nr:gliding motility-associated C-terminal domain-containing protein [Flavobacteriales bacterium]
MKKAILMLAAIFVAGSVFSQNSKVKWSANLETPKSFIENRTQFDGGDKLPDSEILFAVDDGATHIYFTATGLTYRFDTFKPMYPSKGERTSADEAALAGLNHVQKEREEKRLIVTTDLVHMKWTNANPNIEVVGLEKTPEYHNYSLGEKGSIDNVPAFEKLVYKNVYPNIDVAYVFHPEGGIKYSFVLHPGADASNIEMQYSSVDAMQIDAAGKVHFPTMVGDILENAPVTFYADSENEKVDSRFVLDGNTLKLQLADFNTSRKLIIDPWVQTPTLADSDGVWECESDGSDNVYIIGGESPLTLLKYDALGALQWTYATPYDTASGWLGSFATDDVGNSYVSNGSTGALQKINTSGVQVWSITSAGLSDEYWTISFNCDQSKLIVGGTSAAGFPPTTLDATIFEIDVTNGSILNTQVVMTSPLTGIPPEIEEVRSLTSSRNARYYFLTHSFIGAIDQEFSPCFNGEPIFIENSGYELAYKNENYRPNNGNAGIKAIRANDVFVYTVNGTDVQKRSLADGSILGTASIPGGGSGTDLFGKNAIENAGIDIDDCGNVYVGSGNAVHKYDADLNLLSTQSTDFSVYDVQVNGNGELIVAGSTGTDATINRTGYVQTFDMGSCNPLELVCCNPNICLQDPLCDSDDSVILGAGSPDGVWSGNGITDAATGEFDPAVAGIGTHMIAYTLPCGADSIEIVVGGCVPLQVCLEPNGDLTVQNGAAVFSWEQQEVVEDCSTCFPALPPFIEACSTPPGCAVMDTIWVEFTTGTTVTPTSYPVKVTDASGVELIIADPSALPPCVICDYPELSNTFENPTCTDGNDGSIDFTVTGNSTYSVEWDNAETTEDLSDLTAGIYIATITDDSNQACFQLDTIILEDGQAPTIDNIEIVGASCQASDGSLTITASGDDAPFNYSIDNGNAFQLGNAFTGLSVANYDVVVEDALGCQTIEMVSVTNIGAPTLDDIVAVDPSCGATDGTIELTASGGTAPLQYSIDGGSTFQSTGSFSSLAGDTYDIVIEDAGGCQLTDQVILNATTNPSIDNVAATDPACAGSDGQIIITASGGTLPFSYSIDNGVTTQTTATFSGLEIGDYDIVVVDAAGCQSDATVTLNTDDLPSITDVTPTDLTCNSGCNGSLEINATGGTTPFEYSLDGNSFQNSNTFSAVCAADYNVVVRDANGCEATSSTVTVGTEPYVDVNAIDFTASVVCAGDEIVLTAQITDGLAPYNIDWDNGDTGMEATVEPQTTTVYEFNVEDDCGKTAVGEAEVTVPTYNVQLQVIPDSIICELDEINLYVSATGGALDQYTYNWTGQDIVSGDESDTAMVVSTVSVDGGEDDVVLTYIVDVTDLCQEVVSGNIELTIENCDLFVPNAFTPGDDEFNDKLVIANLDKYPNSFLQIYNRWGICIYESDNYQNDWDGKKYSDGVYYYVLKPSDTEIDPLTGYIQLLRPD